LRPLAGWERFDPDHPECPHNIVVMLPDGDIFANRKFMIAKAISAFVVIGVAVDIVMESPLASWLSDQVTYLIRLVLPEAADAAALAIFFPGGWIETAFPIERANEFIAVAVASLRVFPVPGEFQSYFF